MKLKKIDLRKCKQKDDSTDSGYIHPDISTRKWYLVKVGTEYAAGKFDMEWYGLNFDGFPGYDSGLQLDKPGVNGSEWKGILEIVK